MKPHPFSRPENTGPLPRGGHSYYNNHMIEKLNIVVYPEGDTQEIDRTLHINEMVDVNGLPLSLPLPTNRMIAFRVHKINTRLTRNEEIREHYLEIIPANELREYVK
jgi:hypothetical protein